jgi:hypothetical protein
LSQRQGGLVSDGGVLALREIETRLGIANRLAACVAKQRANLSRFPG